MTDRAASGPAADDGAREVLYEVRDHVATVTLNRPERRNAITASMLGRLTAALLRADRDPDVRVVLLTGAGRGFCAGLDLKDATTGSGIGSRGQRIDRPTTRDLPTVVLHQMDTPVIGVLNGAAAGYGFDLALGCDLRLLAASATLLPAFTRIGVVPESGGTWYLPRLVGWARAAEIAYLAEDIPAAEAERLGLVNRVVPDDELTAEAARWAARIAANAPLAVSATKRLFRHGLTADFEGHTHHVLLQMLHLMGSSDFREGLAGAVDRRRPRFVGA
ncbi:MAG TPA: enoyl-CoA hydratase-related protein [Acidimicrobiales bacterium]